jgi:Flp pilus assembly protein TadD
MDLANFPSGQFAIYNSQVHYTSYSRQFTATFWGIHSSAHCPSLVLQWAPMKPLPLIFLLLAGPVYAQRGEDLFQKGQYAQAVAAFESLTEAEKTGAVLNHLGMSHHLLGRFADAQLAYERALRVDSGLAAARNNLGALYYSQRKFGDADREFRRAADRDADNPVLSQNLHYARYARDNQRDARAQADSLGATQSLLLEPVDQHPGDFLAVASLISPTTRQDAASHTNRADVFVARKLYEDAVIEYKRAFAIDRYDASIANRLGIAYHNLRKFRDSEQQYREAIRLRPNHLDAMNNLAVIEYMRGDYVNALGRYKAALKLKPTSVSVLRNMGACLFALERWEEGIAVYQQALALKPDLFDPQPSGAGPSIQMDQRRSSLMNFYLAKVFALRGNTDVAMSYLFKAVESGFDDIRMLRQEEAFKTLENDERFERVLQLIEAKQSGTE